MEKYEKTCIESNDDFSIYYGTGTYLAAKQSSFLHYDASLSISYMRQCSGKIKIEGRQFPIQSGDIIVTNPGEIHCCSIDDGSYHERISLCINKSILTRFSLQCDELLAVLEKQTGNIILSKSTADFQLGERMLQILHLSRSKSNKNRILCICKIIELLDQISSISSHNTPTPAYYVEENPVIIETIEYVSKHFTEDIDCAQIAKKLFISKYRLEHLFKENVGMSLWEYVIIKRLLLVNERIQQKYSVAAASQEAGFHNYSNFYRLYKKYFNLTPIEYRKCYQSKITQSQNTDR